MTKALIIDDIPENIEMLAAFLEIFGIDSVGATSGQEGFKLAQSYQPDVIFSDLIMPDHTWNGYQTIENLRQHPRTTYMPIVAITASGEEDRAYEAGCDFFLTRPFQQAGLKYLLNGMRLIEQRR